MHKLGFFSDFSKLSVTRILRAALAKFRVYTVFQKKTPTHITGYKLMNSCLILIIFGIKIPHII